MDSAEDTCIGMTRDSHQTIADETEALDCEFKIRKGPGKNIDAIIITCCFRLGMWHQVAD